MPPGGIIPEVIQFHEIPHHNRQSCTRTNPNLPYAGCLSDVFSRPAQPILSPQPPNQGVSSMHFDAHQPIIDDLEARIVTIRDSL